jgi:hypothetical protein
LSSSHWTTLAGIFAVFVLVIGQSASSTTGGSLGVELCGNPFFELFPFFLVCLLIDGAVLVFEL